MRRSCLGNFHGSIATHTRPETNIAPEHRPLEGESTIRNHHFFCCRVRFRECTSSFMVQFLMITIFLLSPRKGDEKVEKGECCDELMVPVNQKVEVNFNNL